MDETENGMEQKSKRPTKSGAEKSSTIPYALGIMNNRTFTTPTTPTIFSGISQGLFNRSKMDIIRFNTKYIQVIGSNINLVSI